MGERGKPMDNNKRIRKQRKTNEKQGKPTPMENTELVRKMKENPWKTNQKQRKSEEDEGKPLKKQLKNEEDGRCRKTDGKTRKTNGKNKGHWRKTNHNTSQYHEKQGKLRKTIGKKRRNMKENAWKNARTKLVKCGKTDGKTTKMKEEYWTSNENGGKPLKMQGKQRKPIGKHKEKQTRTKNKTTIQNLLRKKKNLHPI